MTYKSRCHEFFISDSSTEERMRNRFMIKDLCPYCEYPDCKGTSKETCNFTDEGILLTTNKLTEEVQQTPL